MKNSITTHLGENQFSNFALVKLLSGYNEIDKFYGYLVAAMEYTYNEQFRGNDIALKIHKLKTELNTLEEEYKQKDPLFSISGMYSYTVLGRKLLFATTPNCTSVELKKRMQEIALQIVT